MRKLLSLERNIMIRIQPVLNALLLVGATTYVLLICLRTGSIAYGAAAIACLISMSILTAIAGVLLLFLQGLQRLRFG